MPSKLAASALQSVRPLALAVAPDERWDRGPQSRGVMITSKYILQQPGLR